MLAEKDTVMKLIPQGEGIRMVDSLLYHDDTLSRTEFFIQKNNLFIVDGCFSEEGMIENIAQSSAIRTSWNGWNNSADNEFLPQVGIIGAVKNFRLYRNPLIDTKIITEVEVLAEIFNATMIHGKIIQDGELLAEAELKIFIQDIQ